MSSKNHNRKRVVGALACLLAIAVLYAPLAAAAFSPSVMACCTGKFCNIPKHHHKSNAAPSQTSSQAPAAAHEDCGHNMAANVTGMSDCSMDCCQTHEAPAVSSVTFVMPPLFFASISMHVTRAAETARAIEIPRAIEPASPPPRLLINIL